MPKRGKFKDFYIETFQAVHAFVQNRHRGGTADVDDIVEATFDVVRRKWHKKKMKKMTIAERRSWTFGVAKKQILRYRRAAERRARISDKLSRQRFSNYSDPFYEVAANHLLEEALRVAGEHSEFDAQVIGMQIEGWRYDEMAAELGMTEGAVRTGLSRARARLWARGVGIDEWLSDE